MGVQRLEPRGGTDLAYYEYRCERDGVVELRLPVGTAGNVQLCPMCDQAARRVFSPPMIRHPDRSAVALIDRTENTQHEPEVVTSLPPRHPSKRTPMAPSNPALQRLPRP